MDKNYQKLSIDTTRLDEWVRLDSEEFFKDPTIERRENEKRIQFTIKDTSKAARIDFIKCKGGLLTIYPNVGSNIRISEAIAEKIFKRATNPLKDSPYTNGFSIPLAKEDFDTLIELIKGTDGVQLDNYSRFDDEGKAKYDQYRFIGAQGDAIVIKHFDSTDKMQMQGKPLSLFNEVVMILGEKIEKKEDLVDAQLKYCNIKISHAEIFDELKYLLGENLYTFLPSTHKAILSSSLVYYKIDVPLEDYSILVLPANRAFEGFAKKAFSKYGLRCKSTEQLKQFFDWDDIAGIGKPKMKAEYYCNLDKEVADGLTAIYTYCTRTRNPYMHAGIDSISTKIIEKRSIAEERLFEIISEMKSWMDWLSNH